MSAAKKPDEASLSLIGRIHTPFKAEGDVPIQGTAAKAKGTVAVLPKWEQALTDLSGFDRIWLIYLTGAKPVEEGLIVPRLDEVPHGVFATRSLQRPNPIGLTCVRLLRVESCTLHVEGVDMPDGVGLLDIKPYVPRYDAYEAWAGWLENRIPHEEAWRQGRKRPARPEDESGDE